MSELATTVRLRERVRRTDIGSAVVRDIRMTARQRREALSLTRRGAMIRTMRWTALVSICFTTALVFSENVNQRWSRIVLQTSEEPAILVDVDQEATPLLVADVAAMEVDVPPTNVPLVVLNSIEPLDPQTFTTVSEPEATVEFLPASRSRSHAAKSAVRTRH